MTIAAGVDVGTGAVKAALFRVEGGNAVPGTLSHGPHGRGSPAGRALLPALVVLMLVGVVAIASRGSSAGGSSETRRPGDGVLDTILSLTAVAFLPMAALEYLASLPNILAVQSLRELAARIRRARALQKPIIWGIGGHVIKTGLAPVIIELMNRGFATAMIQRLVS